ncbi:fhkC, partial [Symbiodinium sp. CCMP2456]
VSRADREDASIVKARQRELAELQQRREAEIRATRSQQEEEQRQRQEEQQRQQEERQRHLRAQRAAEERRQKEANLWASTRMAQLRQELRGLRGLSTSARKAHIRALQLELHPDKQPEERRQEAKRLFLLVQSEWETLQSSSEMPWEGPSPTRAHKAQADWAQRRAQTFDEAKKEAKPQARAPPKPPPGKDPPRPKTSQERKPSEFRFCDLPEDSASEDEGDCLEL